MNPIEKMADYLDGKLEAEPTKLPVEIFTEYIVPHIGNINDDNKFLMSKWAELAGSPYKPVELINKDGEVVDTVPPLFNSDVYANDNNVNKLEKDFKKARVLNQSIPGSGNAEIDKILPERVKHNDNIEKWLELKEKYSNNIEEEYKDDDEDDLIINYD